MQMNLDEIKRLMCVFIDSDKAHITLNDLGARELKTEHQRDSFIFHIRLLVENGLISDQKLVKYSTKHIGFAEINGVIKRFLPLPIRLTQDGHDFVNALSNEPVFNALKANYQNAPFDVIIGAGRMLLIQSIQERGI